MRRFDTTHSRSVAGGQRSNWSVAPNGLSIFHPRLRDLRSAVEAGRFEGVRTYLAAIEDIERREFAIEQIAATIGPRQTAGLRHWVAAGQTDWLVRLVSGAHTTLYAGAILYGGTGRTISPDTKRLVESVLDAAHGDLDAAIVLNPADPSAYSFLIDLGRWMRWDETKLYGLLAEIHLRLPWHVGAHNRMLLALSPRLGGSRSSMLQFARGVAAHAPVKHPVQAVLAAAHVEAALDNANDEYWQQPFVRNDIFEAAERATSEATMATWANHYAHSVLSYCAWRARADDLFWREFDALEVIAYPWLMFDPSTLGGAYAEMAARRGLNVEASRAVTP